MTADIEKSYRDHYIRHFGKPDSVSSFEEGEGTPPIHIIGFDNVLDGCRTFFSLGLTNYRKEVARTVEVYAPASNGLEIIPTIVANVLYFLIQQNMQIGIGQSIMFDSAFPDFVNEYSKTSLYFTMGGFLPDETTEIQTEEGLGNLFSAIFITPDEHRYFIDCGIEAFETILEKRLKKPFDIARPSVMLGSDFS